MRDDDYWESAPIRPISTRRLVCMSPERYTALVASADASDREAARYREALERIVAHGASCEHWQCDSQDNCAVAMRNAAQMALRVHVSDTGGHDDA